MEAFEGTVLVEQMDGFAHTPSMDDVILLGLLVIHHHLARCFRVCQIPHLVVETICQPFLPVGASGKRDLGETLA